MTRSIFALLLWLGAAASLPAAEYVLHAGELVDVEAMQVLEKMTVVVRDNRISAVHGGYQSPGPGQELIDLKDHTLMPGLMDMHTHITGEHSPQAYTEGFFLEPADVALRATVYAERTLMAGFTTIRDLGELIVVEGDISPADKEQIEKIAKAFPALVNLPRVAAVPMEKMIHMAVQIVEFNTNALEQLGVKWGSPIDGPGAAAIGDAVNNDVFRPGIPATTSIPQSVTLPTRVDPLRIYLGIATSITSKINLAVSDGDAYVLASPTLSTRSGGEANFLAGGEVPLPSTSSTGQTNVEFKEYGIKLDIKPVADKENNILSKVGTEISSIDPSAEVNVRHGETLVLSNLMSTESSRNFDKFPWLGDVPVLGWLFKSKNWREKRTELVIFVTPRIVDPASDEVKGALERGEQIRSNFKSMINDGIVY